MPLGGTGAVLGAALSAAVGGPAAGAAFFAAVGDVIASWSLQNVYVFPGTMVAAGASVTGAGKFKRNGSHVELGALLAAAVGGTDAGNVAKWTVVASSFLDHLETFGTVDPSGFVAPGAGGTLTGAGKIAFGAMAFVPPLAVALGLTDPGNQVALAAFTAALLGHVMANASIVAVSIIAPFTPLTAPSGGGPITGAGSIT